MNGEFCIDKDYSWIRSPCLSFCRHCGLPNVLVPCAPRLPTQSERRPPQAPCKTMHDIASTMWNVITAYITYLFWSAHSAHHKSVDIFKIVTCGRGEYSFFGNSTTDGKKRKKRGFYSEIAGRRYSKRLFLLFTATYAWASWIFW